MAFRTDAQTLEDLNILGKFKKSTVFSAFNQCRTDGGERVLEKMFTHPMTDENAINRRSQLFRLFQKFALELPFEVALLDKSLLYIQSIHSSSWPGHFLLHGKRQFNKLLGLQQEDEQFKQGLQAWLSILSQLRPFLKKLHQEHGPEIQGDPVLAQDWIIHEEGLSKVLESLDVQKLSFFSITHIDYLLRVKWMDQMQAILALIYQLDVYTSVSQIAADRGLKYAEAVATEENILDAKNVRHATLKGAIGNDLYFDQHSNLFFLTGANMAGKSTFMKSYGICMYLAHMGFPVPADYLRFSVKDGMYTSINVSDNLNMGYSHYYAEVLRVKNVAVSVSKKNRLIIIFDELFKGTNVKDAYEATFEVTKAFKQYKGCCYLISTHIVEVGEDLQKLDPNITFRYMPTIMKGTVPTYTYRATDGISSDKHGMILIENEGILEMLDSVPEISFSTL